MATEDPQYAYRQRRFEGYIAERDALRKDSLEISGRYDKAILALAGGALALSITFLEKIAPHPSSGSAILLALAWVFLIAAVLLELWALALSQAILNLQEAVGQAEYQRFLQSLPEYNHQNPVATVPAGILGRKIKYLGWVNICSRWAVAIGIVMLCVFSLCNLPSLSKIMSKPQSAETPPPAPTTTTNIPTSKGSYVPPASVLPPPPPPAPPAAPAATP